MLSSALEFAMPRRAASDAALTRHAIAAVARAAFSADGYAGASTARIARDAGVSEGALFHHFLTKAALRRDVFVAMEKELDAYVRAASRDGPPMDAFLAGCRSSMQFRAWPDYQRVVLVMGAINEVIFALAREETGGEIEACLEALARMLSPWMDGQGDNSTRGAGSSA